MAMVECKENGGQISQNADTCPQCGDVINEPLLEIITLFRAAFSTVASTDSSTRNADGTPDVRHARR
jgi:hypothetical protein